MYSYYLISNINMADITCRVLDLNQDIRLKMDCVVLDHTHKKTHSEIKGNIKMASEKKCVTT